MSFQRYKYSIKIGKYHGRHSQATSADCPEARVVIYGSLSKTFFPFRPFSPINSEFQLRHSISPPGFPPLLPILYSPLLILISCSTVHVSANSFHIGIDLHSLKIATRQ